MSTTNCCLTNLGCLQIPVSTINNSGITGAAGTIAVGTVTTGGVGSSVTVTNVGTATAAVLDFSIPVGATGETGANGSTRLYYNTTSSTNSTPSSWQTLRTYTLPADTLDTNGDSLVICGYITDSAAPLTAGRRITFDGNSCTFSGGFEPFSLQPSASNLYLTKVELIRTSATTATCSCEYKMALNTGINNATYETNLTGLDFTQNNDIDFDVYQAVGSTIDLRILTIDLLSI